MFVVCGVSVLVDDNFDVNEKMTDCRGSINESAVSEIVTQSAPCTTIVFLISCGISKIVGMIFTPYGWGQKFTLNNPIEHLLDLFKFYKEAFEG